MNKPPYILEIPADEYHQATKENKYLSSHRLHLFRRCPALYHKHAMGEIVESDTQSFIIGRATHTFILEGADVFEREYIVSDGPTNPKTGLAYGARTKAYLDWAASLDRPVISPTDFSLLEKMKAAVEGHEKARELLSAGFAESVVRTEWEGEPIQTRMDWFDPERGILVDLKTCQDLDRFKYDVRDFGYPYQLAFYERALVLAGYDRPVECWIIAVEKREPYRVGVFNVVVTTIDDANFANTPNLIGNEWVIRELKDCREKDFWPTRWEGFGYI